MDPIREAAEGDVLLAISVAPYTRATIEIVHYAQKQGIPIVAVTDSEVSPVARAATASILIETDGPSFFHSMTSAFVVAEILAALIAGRGGDESLRALRRTEDQLTSLNIHWLT
jgi:DNA-binding MurR/RpiR family transcriptional regulator